MKSIGRLFLILMTMSLLCIAVFSAEKISPAVADDMIFVAAPEELPRLVAHDGGTLSESVLPESTVYFPIQNAVRAEDLTGLRALTGDWTSGEACAGAPRIEYRMMYDANGQKELGYRYVVALPVLEVSDQLEYTLSGRIAVSRRWTGSRPINFSFRVCHGNSNLSADSIMCASANLPIDFSVGAGQLSLLFSDLARFEVDVTGQGIVNIGFSWNVLTDIAAQYPDAKLRFLVWNKSPIFDHIGRLLIYAEPDERLYELTPKGLVAGKAEFSAEDEAFILETRRLGGYVVSDRELGAPLSAIAAPNPPTGRDG
ncbi:MAG: hypothetical protein RR197_04785 [Oscillospiraceae bacterium]